MKQSNTIGGIYMIRLSDTHYYGGRAKNFESRWRGHLRALKAGKHHSSYMQRVYDKYGRFEPEAVLAIAGRENQEIFEQYWLDMHFKQPGCVNENGSAEGPPDRTGMKLSASHKEQISKRHTGKITSEETKVRMSVSNIGKHETSDATREKMRNSHLGQFVSEETRLLLSEGNRNRSQEYKDATAKRTAELWAKRKAAGWTRGCGIKIVLDKE